MLGPAGQARPAPPEGVTEGLRERMPGVRRRPGNGGLQGLWALVKSYPRESVLRLPEARPVWGCRAGGASRGLPSATGGPWRSHRSARGCRGGRGRRVPDGPGGISELFTPKRVHRRESLQSPGSSADPVSAPLPRALVAPAGAPSRRAGLFADACPAPLAPVTDAPPPCPGRGGPQQQGPQPTPFPQFEEGCK